MKKKVIIELLEFEDLTDKQKEEMFDHFREKEMFDSLDADGLLDDFKYKLEEKGYNREIGISFSLSNSQGDGVGFNSGVIDHDEIIKILERLENKELKNTLDDLKGNFDITFNAEIIDKNIRYYHYNSFNIEVESEVYNEISEKTLETVEKTEDEIKEIILEDLKDISRELERDGYKEIEYHFSDEYIKDFIINDDTQFVLDKNNKVRIWDSQIMINENNNYLSSDQFNLEHLKRNIKDSYDHYNIWDKDNNEDDKIIVDFLVDSSTGIYSLPIFGEMYNIEELKEDPYTKEDYFDEWINIISQKCDNDINNIAKKNNLFEGIEESVSLYFDFNENGDFCLCLNVLNEEVN